jgi:hypothetical protein
VRRKQEYATNFGDTLKSIASLIFGYGEVKKNGLPSGRVNFLMAKRSACACF